MKPVKVLVTGAGGLLATYLTPPLSDQELILTEYPQHQRVLNGDFLPMDITNYNQVYGLLSEHIPDEILHLAAYTNVGLAEKEQEKCRQINVGGTANIALAAAEIRKKFPQSCFMIYISTDYVFDGEKPGGLYEETDLPNPKGYYGKTKKWGEDKVLDTLPNASLIIRTSFKPIPYKHPEAPIDMWFSADYVNKIALEIALAVLNCHFVVSKTPNGIIHIATGRKSAYDLALLTNPDVKPTTRAKILTDHGTDLPKNVSLNISKWKLIKGMLLSI